MKAKAPKPKKVANRRVRLLRSKLEVMAQRGTENECKVAQTKLDKLLARYDFKAPTVEIGDMFRGTFKPSAVSRWLATFPRNDQDIAAAAKWAIEHATGLKASFRGDAIHVEADNACVPQLVSITQRISNGFKTLWERFQIAPGVTVRDRGLFFRGLYDGMMQDARPVGESLPARHVKAVRRSRKRNALETAPGLGIHPYSVALDLGRQLRFETPVTDIVGSLEEKIGERKILSERAAT